MENSSPQFQRPWLNSRDQMTSRDWTDLPLLPSIVDHLGLIDLLRFRAVCKDWNSASFAATAEIEAIPDQETWCLIYGGNNSECSLITEYAGKHTIYIPEINGATCLASSQGWLLLFREGSMFFFCPLSGAKIDLPGPFPHTAINDHVAVFSAPPTSKDCVVAVVSRTETETLELHMIDRGATAWTEHKLASMVPTKIQYAAHYNGGFYFFDNKSDSMVYVSIEKRELRLGKVRYMKSAKDKSIPLRFSTNSEKENMKKRLGLEDGVQVSICGTVVSCESSADKMVAYENTWVGADDVEGRQIVKAAWFQPRFHRSFATNGFKCCRNTSGMHASIKGGHVTVEPQKKRRQPPCIRAENQRRVGRVKLKLIQQPNLLGLRVNIATLLDSMLRRVGRHNTDGDIQMKNMGNTYDE
ncbi:hypothetical protein J1N35_011866 [Gossypium stocksii]|uniref:F-box domain-containing protein n=1 Tax=Gossypium stocksii TaxID=47602 RepID=A0A9D3W4A3_9ROSI|nr:hypothetical protein J1N35_011866 [Gossypium stocksii]